MEQVSNPLRRECLSIPELVPVQYKKIVTSIKLAIQDIADLGINKIILTGCGDSYFASVSTKPVFDKYLASLSIKTVAMQAIDVSRYYKFEEDEKTLLVVVSASGGAARLVEVLQRAKKYNVPSLIVTNTPDSVSAKEASYILHTNTPEFPKGAPGLRSYVASLLGLELFAISLSEILTDDVGTETDKFENEVIEYAKKIEEVLASVDEKAKAIAADFNTCSGFEVVVDAPYFATGKFVAAKYPEVSGDMCTVIDSENYCHVNTFMYPRADIGTLFIIDSNEGNYSRILETLNQATLEGRKTAVVVIGDSKDLAEFKGEIIELPGASVDVSMLFAFLPGALMASYQAEINGDRYFRGSDEYLQSNTLRTNDVVVV